MMKRLLISCALCAVTLGLAGSNAWAAPIPVKLAITPQMDSAVGIAAQEFKKFIEETSNGKYVVDIYAGSSFGNADTCFQAARMGTLHLVFETPGNLAQFCPEMAAYDMPYLMPTTEAVKKVMNGPMGAKMLGFLDKKGVASQGYMYGGTRYLFSTQPYSRAEEFNGTKHRTTGSKSHMQAIRAMGFAPVPIAGSECVTSLQQGVVTSIDVEPSAARTYRFSDVCKFALDTEHLPVLYILYASNPWLKKLPTEDKALFDQGIAIMLQKGNDVVESVIAADIEAMKKEDHVVFTTMTPADKAVLAEKAKACYSLMPQNIQNLTQEIVQAIQ